MITISFFFYIQVHFIGTLISKSGPRFIIRIICIIDISFIHSTKLVVIYPEL